MLRRLVAAARWPSQRAELPDLSHLTLFNEEPNGPVQREEALFLYSLLRVVRPKTVVEIGFLNGRSAHNFLRALDSDGRLYSFDIDDRCAERAQRLFGHDSRFVFRTRSQTELTRDDIDGREADFIFLDASHELISNQSAFERLLKMMSPTAILAVHDTGTVPRELFPSWHWLLETDEDWVGDEYEGQPDERAFMNWLLEEHPEFSQIHFHSRRVIRCGITVLQRSAPLARPASP
jgi:predicted O-methyltransferase YrrM